MPQCSAFGEENNRMGIWKAVKDENGEPDKEFLVKSNWVAVPIKEVTNGHVWKVTTFPHGVKGFCYVPANADRDEFVNWCKKEFASLSYVPHNIDDIAVANGALWCSLEKSTFKSEMGAKINDFSQSANYAVGRTTSILGRVPDSDVWVLSREIQINSDGNVIPENDQRYFYFPKKSSWKLSVSSRQEPCYMRTIERNLDHIFDDEKWVSAYLGIGGVVMAMHAAYVNSLFDNCPQVCFVGEPGRGKTTVLRTSQGILGMQNIGFFKTISREGLISRASTTTMGIHVDDQKTLKAITEAVVDFFNMAKSETFDRGTEDIRCGLVFTSNTKLPESTDREYRRVAYVCFPGDTLGARSPEHLEAFVNLKKLRDDGSLSRICGSAIKIGSEFVDHGWQRILREIVPQVTKQLDGALPDVFLSYSILLWFSYRMYCLGINDKDEVQRREELIFSKFVQYQAPLIIKYQPKVLESSSSLGRSPILLDTFKTEVLSFIKESSREEVEVMLKLGSYSNKSGTTVNALIVHPKFFKRESLTFRQADVNQHLKQADHGSGKCLSRRFRHEDKSVACTAVNETFFEKEQLLIIKQAIPEKSRKNFVQRSAHNETSSRQDASIAEIEAVNDGDIEEHNKQNAQETSATQSILNEATTTVTLNQWLSKGKKRTHKRLEKTSAKRRFRHDLNI